jgi:LysM repeat protein
MLITPRQALQQAYTALKNGDRRSAHHWAARAAQAAPGLEEAWLVLAACASPRASVAYLERALQINPQSQRARQGLRWARKRLIAEQRAKRPSLPPRAAPKPKKRPTGWGMIAAFSTLILLAATLALIAFWPDSTRSHAPQPVAAQIWAATTLLRGEPPPGALPVKAASPTPLLVTPTPGTDPIPSTQSPTQADFSSETATPLETATQAEALAALPTAETETPAPPEPDPIPDSGFPSHIVQPDEDVADIAIWYGIEISELLVVNELKSAEQVQPGMALKIPPAEYSAPPPSYAAAKLILVSISQQHLWAYENDQLVYSFVASTGMGNSTRVGTFEVLNKIPSAYGATWNIWMPSWMGIYWSGHLQNGIHALPILPNGAILWEGYLGTPISYGCVVLGTYEAQLLYDWAEVGTTVKIDW